MGKISTTSCITLEGTNNMAKEEKLNEEAALNNNLGSTTLQANHDIRTSKT